MSDTDSLLIVVKNIPNNYSQKDLKTCFEKFGSINSVKIINETGYVYFKNVEDRNKALKHNNV
jgi:RNA recognition motif-containing protein